MKTAMPRTSYLPAALRNVDPIVPEGTDLAIWAWEEHGKSYGIAFQGKSQKPLWHYRFVSADRRAEQIRVTVASRRAALARKAEASAAKKAYQHDLRVGDILNASWGYDQTNVDFYQVVDVKGKVVVVREIGGKLADKSTTADYLVPVPGSFHGEPMRRRPNQYGSVKIDDCRRASKWDGKPCYQTAFGYGH
jgi:hypothetical protein